VQVLGLAPALDVGLVLGVVLDLVQALDVAQDMEQV